MKKLALIREYFNNVNYELFAEILSRHNLLKLRKILTLPFSLSLSTSRKQNCKFIFLLYAVIRISEKFWRVKTLATEKFIVSGVGVFGVVKVA